MQLVFSHPNPMIVGSMASLLAQHGIDSSYRNEFLAGGAGELAPGETWLELWVEARHQSKAEALIREAMVQPERDEWRCNHCQEANPATFEVCWRCGEPAGE